MFLYFTFVRSRGVGRGAANEADALPRSPMTSPAKKGISSVRVSVALRLRGEIVLLIS
jgi:hypothetical protein